MSKSREIEINNFNETTVDNLLNNMYANKGSYMLTNGQGSIIVCMENDVNYIFEHGLPTYGYINPSKLALSVQINSSLGLNGNDKVGYSKLSENRDSLIYKCFGQEERQEQSYRPGYR